METIDLILNQTPVVWDVIQKDGVAYCKKEYITKKYEESARVFMTIYSWFVAKAQDIVPRPEGAEFPYWSQRELVNLDTSGYGHVFKVRVPLDEVVLYDYRDWVKILQFKYLAENEADEKAFEAEMKAQGCDEYKAMSTAFYPMIKQKIMRSWERLFRHDAEIKAGTSDVANVTGALWCIKRDWIIEEL